MPPPKPKHKPTRLTATQEIVAGFAAGVADAVACHPVDVVKTRAHVNRGANAPFVRELARQVRSIQTFFAHRSVSTLDRVPFQLTGENFLYGTTLISGVLGRDPLAVSRRPPGGGAPAGEASGLG